jgi:alanine racemase
MPDRLTIADINLNYYAHNLSEIRALLASEVQIMAIVKANAYGHGLVPMATQSLASGASYLGVVSLGELKKIREASIQAPVLILNYLDSASMDEATALNGTVTVMDQTAITALQAVASAHQITIKVHIKIDTGMHRAGCDPADLLGLAQAITESSNLELEGVFTHFAESEATDKAFTNQQLQTFNQYVRELDENGLNPPLIHCANSAAIIAFPETHWTMVRPGLISYGLNPFPVEHPKYAFVKDSFKPVLSLKTQVVFIRELKTGETVGYNRRWKANRPSRVALLPVGYGDGWRRTPHNAGRVIVDGQYAPIVGSVAMDQTVIDVTDIATVSVGDEVVLLGMQANRSITADDIATAYGTINYEVVTALSDRISRIYHPT